MLLSSVGRVTDSLACSRLLDGGKEQNSRGRRGSSSFHHLRAWNRLLTRLGPVLPILCFFFYLCLLFCLVCSFVFFFFTLPPHFTSFGPIPNPKPWRFACCAPLRLKTAWSRNVSCPQKVMKWRVMAETRAVSTALTATAN